jgi:hypothetical protein
VTDPSLFIYYPFNETLTPVGPAIGETVPSHVDPLPIPNHEGSVSRGSNPKHKDLVPSGVIPNHKGNITRESISNRMGPGAMNLIFNLGVAGSALDLQNRKVPHEISLFEEL